jgi:hypothetical protein
VAVLIAVAGTIDPALALRRPVPLPVEIRVPAAHDPDYAEASRVKRDVLAQLGAAVTTVSPDHPRAIVAIGNTHVHVPAGTPLFAISMPQRSPSVSILNAFAPEGAAGQEMSVALSLVAKGMKGRKTDVTLRNGSMRLGSIEHQWTRDDEVLDARVPVSPGTPGLSIVRVSVRTAGAASAEVDVPVFSRARQFRVFIYEPRPSWAASFVRQAIEAHQIFQVVGAARTSRGAATVTSEALASLTSSQLDEADAVIVSGLDALSTADEAQLHRFVTVRGGALVLVPDAAPPERLRESLQLPQLEELLLERSTAIGTGPGKMRASELLLPRANGSDLHALANVRHGPAERPVVFAVYRGNGQVIFSGALDAWRFRGAEDSAFATFWQSVIADAAGSAAPRVSVDLDPMLARPGQEVRLRGNVRETEWTRTDDGFRLPAVSGALIAASGGTTPVRLWPGKAAGEYIARFAAPQPGMYVVQLTANGRTHDGVLAVRHNASTVLPDRAPALALLAKSSGGALMPSTDLEQMVEKLRAMDRPVVERRVRPVRSAWWIVSFAGVLSAEWGLRRRRGQR